MMVLPDAQSRMLQEMYDNGTSACFIVESYTVRSVVWLKICGAPSKRLSKFLADFCKNCMNPNS